VKAPPHRLAATRPFSGPQTEPHDKSLKHLITFPTTHVRDSGISAFVALKYKHRNKLPVQPDLRLKKYF